MHMHMHTCPHMHMHMHMHMHVCAHTYAHAHAHVHRGYTYDGFTYYRHHELARLSQGWAAEEWSVLDSCGNSVAHRTLTLNLPLTKALTY